MIKDIAEMFENEIDEAINDSSDVMRYSFNVVMSEGVVKFIFDDIEIKQYGVMDHEYEAYYASDQVEYLYNSYLSDISYDGYDISFEGGVISLCCR